MVVVVVGDTDSGDENGLMVVVVVMVGKILKVVPGCLMECWLLDRRMDYILYSNMIFM